MRKILIIYFIILFISCYTVVNDKSFILAIKFLNEFQEFYILSDKYLNDDSLTKDEENELEKRVSVEHNALVDRWSKVREKIINRVNLLFIKHFDLYFHSYNGYIKLKYEYDMQQKYVWDIIDGKIEVSSKELDEALSIYKNAKIYHQPVLDVRDIMFENEEKLLHDWKTLIDEQSPDNLKTVDGIKRIIDFKTIVKSSWK